MARIDPPEESRKRARIRSLEEYETLYRQSIEEPELFWSQRAEEELEWFRKWERAVDGGFERVGQGPYAQYFVGGQINISHNCLDRHVKNGRGGKGCDLLGRGTGRGAEATDLS